MKRPGDVNVRCTVLLMLDYQVFGGVKGSSFRGHIPWESDWKGLSLLVSALPLWYTRKGPFFLVI